MVVCRFCVSTDANGFSSGDHTRPRAREAIDALGDKRGPPLAYAASRSATEDGVLSAGVGASAVIVVPVGTAGSVAKKSSRNWSKDM